MKILHIISISLATILCQINVTHAVTFAEQQDANSYTHKLLDSNKQRKGIEKAATEAVPIILRTWDEAYEMARTFVQQMSLQQKVNITTGIGWEAGPCVGNSGRTTNPNFPELCLQDSPLGVRFADGVSSGVAGINAAASFDKEAIRRRGEYMGAEFRAKGIHAQLGPSMNMMRCPTSGRNWEAFGEDPYLVGVASVETINGIQSQGVVRMIKKKKRIKKPLELIPLLKMAVAKHLIGNEQETNRQLVSIAVLCFSVTI